MTNIPETDLSSNRINIHKSEIGINTDDLDGQTLQLLIENNRELIENEISNIEHEARDIDNTNIINAIEVMQGGSNEISELRKQLIKELNEKEYL
jgi:hypothetical protein